MAFARHQFELTVPQEDGLPLLAHLQVYAENTGKVHPMLANAPPLPTGCAALWHDFLELHTSRGSNGFGAARITYADVHAWQIVSQTSLSLWELDCILNTDAMWLSEFAPKPKADK